jgi:hypothetical protein
MVRQISIQLDEQLALELMPQRLDADAFQDFAGVGVD